MNKKVIVLFFYKTIISFLFLNSISAGIDDYLPINTPTSSNYGNTGIIELPNARFMKEGTLKFGFSSSFPNEYTFMTASPFPWLEATYRYTEIKDKLYGPSSFSGNQSWKDKGFNLKIKLRNESYYLPALALGFRDLAGTGAFSSEYIVGSKQLGDFDISLGMGWGYLGQLNTLKNPLVNLDQSFNVRNSDIGSGGTFNFGDWFSGKQVSLLGGLEYKLKRHGLRLKLEYDTTKPDESYRFNLPAKVQSRFNIGIAYNIPNLADLTLAFERGNQIRFSFAFKGNFSKPNSFINSDRPVSSKSLELSSSDDQRLLYILNELKGENIFLQSAEFVDDELSVSVSQSRFRSQPLAYGRTARVLLKATNEKTNKININLMNGDIETSKFSFSRNSFQKLIKQEISPSEMVVSSTLTSDSYIEEFRNHSFRPKVNFPELFWNMTPAFRHHVGGPEAFYLGQLWWQINADLKLRRNLTISSVVGFDIYNNFDEMNLKSNSLLPHVRSDIQEYLKEGKNNIGRLKLDYIWSPSKDWFMKFDLGLLEEMFGGFGGEILYRPFKSNFAFGLTSHYVKQRDYNQKFDFRDYETLTGHFSSYIKLPNQVLMQIHAGRYLAKDKGFTLDLSRRFETGFRLGIFATRTNISKELFGEGSFDKGFYFEIPLESFFGNYRTDSIDFALHPLTRDGGAILNNSNSLYGIFGETTEDSFLRDFKDLKK